MVKALLKLLALFVTVGFFELLGAVLVIVALWVLTDEVGWALLAAGVFALLKSLDLAAAKERSGR